jgi:hypothetical protein
MSSLISSSLVAVAILYRTLLSSVVHPVFTLRGVKCSRFAFVACQKINACDDGLGTNVLAIILLRP